MSKPLYVLTLLIESVRPLWQPLQPQPLHHKPISAASSSAGAAAEPSTGDVAKLRVELAARVGDAEAARREAAMAKETAAHEMALMRRQLASAQTGQADAEKVRGHALHCTVLWGHSSLHQLDCPMWAESRA